MFTFIAILIFLIWYAYVQDFYTYYVVFFAYAMYWISVNFTGLVFWKIPSYIFNLEENKKYSGIISSGEGISAIISYLSVPVLLSLDFFTRDKFLLISFFGILLLSCSQTIEKWNQLHQKEITFYTIGNHLAVEFKNGNQSYINNMNKNDANNLQSNSNSYPSNNNLRQCTISS